MKIEKAKNKKGITLIALIITIILMLILAGVVISLTLGENGLFNTAKYAAKKWQNAEKEELEELDKLNKLTYNITSFESMLEACNINKKYTLQDLVNNKDGILEKVLSNNNAVDYILSNPEEYLEAFVNSEIAVTMLAQKENTKGKIINNSEWLNGIQTSSNVDSFDKNMELIPAMTSNNTPSGEVIATSYYEQDSAYPYKAFDGNMDTYYFSQDENNDFEIIYKFDDVKMLYKIFAIESYPSESASYSKFDIYVSPDENGDNWEKIKEEEWNWQESLVTRNEILVLKKPKEVRRIKVYTYTVTKFGTCTNVLWEVQAYGI